MRHSDITPCRSNNLNKSRLSRFDFANLPPSFNNSRFVHTLPTDSLLRIQNKLRNFNRASDKRADSQNSCSSNNSGTCLESNKNKSTMAYGGQGDFSEEAETDLERYWLETSFSNTTNKIDLKYDNKKTSEIIDPEMHLQRIGYLPIETIDWKKVDLPEKVDLYEVLISRIRDRRNTDCKVHIGDEVFNCHLIVLQCYSELFDNYTSIGKIEIPPKKCNPESFEFIYNWMISDEKSNRKLTRCNVLDIFESATYLKINDLIVQCWAFLENLEIFNEDTAFLLYTEAKSRNLQKICEIMLPRIQDFFLVLVSSQNWLELDFDDIKEFLSSNYIKINCELEVFMSAIRWLRYDWDERQQYSKELLNCVRFSNLTLLQLVNMKGNTNKEELEGIVDDPDICKLIDDGLKYATFKHYKKNLSETGLIPPVPRNWTGIEQDYTNYRDFLIYLDQYRRKQIVAMNKKARSEQTKRQQLTVDIDECLRRIDSI